MIGRLENACGSRPRLRRWAVAWRFPVLLAAGLVVVSCARDTVMITGWAWPLPPASERSPQFAARATAAADLARLQRSFSWASQSLTGRGSATLPEELKEKDPVVADLLRRAQAREAARRHLADRIAALPFSTLAPASGTTPRLGEPGRLTPEQQNALSSLIASAPVAQEGPAAGGRFESIVSLHLDNVARIALNEPLVDHAAALAEPASVPGATAVPPTPRAALPPGVRDSLPPMTDAEFMTIVQHDSASAAVGPRPSPAPVPEGGEPRPSAASVNDPEIRLEAQRRAEALARQWLWEEARQHRLEIGQTIGELAALMPSVRRVAQQHIDSAPVERVAWDDLGRCRVTLVLDRRRFHHEVEAASLEPESPANHGASGIPLP